MKPITNLSKVIPPRVPDVLQRPRLVDQINKNQDKRLLIILGQAAQGKSTLAASYAGSQEVPVAWLNLDQGDSDPANLFYWLINAFEHCLTDRDLSFLRSYLSASRGPREPIPLYRDWVQVMFEQINDPILLVLDSLDRLTRDAPSLLFIQTLAHEAPPHLRLILISREEPPFGLQELKIKQQAHILNNDDLAFSLEETRVFFRETRKISLTPSQLARIHASTEGWVGGLLLFSEALQRLPENEREKYISEKMPDRFRMEAFQFFEEVILSPQPPEVREFLIKSSILDKMETQFLGDFLETKDMEDMEEVLCEAARKNLFVQSHYEEGKGWVFRYHQLFRNFLLLKFNTELSAETRKVLFLKAGLLFQQRGRLEEAVQHFLSAEAYDLAVSVIEKVGMDLVWSLRRADLQGWLNALPEKIVQENPWLLYYQCTTGTWSSPAENLPLLYQAFTLFEKEGDLRGCLVSLAAFISNTLSRGQDLVPISMLLKKGEELLNAIKPNLYYRERAQLWSAISVGLTFREGNLQKAYQAGQTSFLLAKEAKEPLLEVVALLRVFQARVVAGEITLADETSKEYEKLKRKYFYPEQEIVYQILRIILFLHKGDLVQAEAVLELVRKESERLGLGYLYTHTLKEHVLLKINLGQYREAEDLGLNLIQQAVAQGNSFVAGNVLVNLGRKCSVEGDYQRAEEYLQQAQKIFSAEECFSPWYLNCIKVVRGSLGSPVEQDETTLKDLHEALDFFSSFSGNTAIEAHFALALFYWQKDDRNKTAQHLHSGLKMAREKGAAYFPYISPRIVAKTCALAIELGDQEDSDYALKILSTRRLPQAEAELERLSKHAETNIRSKASTIRLALHRSNRPRLRIETLGDFRVLRSDSPLKEEEWRGSQTKNLLKAIVAQGAEGVRKEVLMESLWPEGQQTNLENNFKNALHRLRQILEPDMDPRYGYSYVRLKENRVSLDQGICEVDVDKFLTLLKEGEKREASQQIEEALSFFQQAADLYRGDFLPDDVYAEWVDSRREELRGKYLDLLFRTARIYEDRGAPRKAVLCYKKAVEYDPFSEEAHRRLMVLYAAIGKHDEALNIYTSYQKALREELDAEPDPITKSSYKKIENR
jgi:LuxR family transcriptional regulator, maltose regulon positive regulatory protein